MKKIIVASDLHGSGFTRKTHGSSRTGKRRNECFCWGTCYTMGPAMIFPKAMPLRKSLRYLRTRLAPYRLYGAIATVKLIKWSLLSLSWRIMPLMMVGERTYFVTHGHHYNLSALPPLGPGDILLHGHTHVPNWTPFGTDHWVLNPGSVTLPKENSPHSYLVIKGSKVTWKTLDGEIFHEMDLTNY